jgi:hypothetical protein
MHDHGDEIRTSRGGARRTEGEQVRGIVVCHHVYGLGIYLPDRDEYGHVNITAIKPPGERIDGPADFPPVGGPIEGTVLGYTGVDQQLRVSMVPREGNPER